MLAILSMQYIEYTVIILAILKRKCSLGSFYATELSKLRNHLHVLLVPVKKALHQPVGFFCLFVLRNIHIMASSHCPLSTSK